jgi:hypothetical protein
MDARPPDDSPVESGARGEDVAFGLPRLCASPLSPTWLGERPRGLGMQQQRAWIRRFQLEDSTAPLAEVETGVGRGVIATTGRAVWVANSRSRSLSRLDPESLQLTAVTRLRRRPVAIAAIGDEVWVGCENGWLFRVSDPGPTVDGVARLGQGLRGLSVGGSSLWAVRRGGELSRVEVSSGDHDPVADCGRGAIDLAVADGTAWVANAARRRLLGVEVYSGRTHADLLLPSAPASTLGAAGRIWVGCGPRRSIAKGTVFGVDPRSGAITAECLLAGRPRALAYGAGSLWVSSDPEGRKCNGRIVQIDPRPTAARVFAAAPVGWPVDDLAFVGGRLLGAMRLSQGAFAGAGGDISLGLAAGG